MTFPEMRSRQRWSGSSAAAGSLRALTVAALLIGACGSSQTGSGVSPTPTPTVQASPTPSPTSTSDETPIAQQVLPPAQDPPLAMLCSKPIAAAADGNATPLFCSNGAVNVLAWKFYADISASILGLGLNPSPEQPKSAMCDDIAHNGANRSEEVNGYKLAAAYYGWTFALDPAKVTCQ